MANTKKKWIGTYDEQKAQVASALDQFPRVFGLKAWPGRRFSIDAQSSFVHPESFEVQLVVTVEPKVEGERWQHFVRETESELRKEIVDLGGDLKHGILNEWLQGRIDGERRDELLKLNGLAATVTLSFKDWEGLAKSIAAVVDGPYDDVDPAKVRALRDAFTWAFVRAVPK